MSKLIVEFSDNNIKYQGVIDQYDITSGWMRAIIFSIPEGKCFIKNINDIILVGFLNKDNKIEYILK